MCGVDKWEKWNHWRGSRTTHVIDKFSLFMYYSKKVSHLKILLPCFSSVIHTMWWLAPNFSDGAEFEFAAPSIRLAVLLNGRIYPSLHLPPLAWLNEWRCRIVVAWCWLTDGLLMWWRIASVPVQRRSHHRRSRKRSRSFEDDDEGHLIYHSGDMLRARCIEYIPFFLLLFTLFLSHSLVVWFYFQTLNRCWNI